nr:LLM class flavin-dependent oxidoreductase [Micromonospora sp. DSM 115978]
MPTVEIGLGLQSDKRPGDYARLASRAEGYGFDVLTVFGDLMYQPPIFPLLEMAAATERVRLGPACLNPYSMAPYEIAGQIAALDLASRGRAYLGLARGTWLGAVGLPQPRPLAALAEAVEVVYRLLRGDPGGFQGRMFRLAEGTTLRYPVHRPDPPLLLGAWGPRGAALAGRIAAEIKVGGSANPAMVAVVRDRLRAGAGPVGRSVDEVGVVLGAVTVVDTDGAAARARARAEVAMYLAVVAGLDPTVDVPADLLDRVAGLVDAGRHEDAGRLIPDDLLDLFAFCGTPEQVAARAQALIDAGVRRVEFGTPHGLTDERGVDLLGSQVLPLLRRDAPVSRSEDPVYCGDAVAGQPGAGAVPAGGGAVPAGVDMAPAGVDAGAAR